MENIKTTSEKKQAALTLVDHNKTQKKAYKPRRSKAEIEAEKARPKRPYNKSKSGSNTTSETGSSNGDDKNQPEEEPQSPQSFYIGDKEEPQPLEFPVKQLIEQPAEEATEATEQQTEQREHTILGVSQYIDKEEPNNITPSQHIADNSRNLKSILAKLALLNSINDTSTLNYYPVKSSPKNEEKPILTELFVDNIIFYGITATSRCKGRTSADCSRYNNIIRDFFASFGIGLNGRHLKAVGISPDNKGDITRSQKDQYKNLLVGTKEEEQFNIINFKAALADIDIKILYKALCPENLQKLNLQGVYIHDIDLTTDIKGCMDKQKLINFLKGDYNFYLEGEGGDLDAGDCIILKNNNLVSAHCLTYLKKVNGVVLRLKFYNKIVQSLESGAVREQVGSHWADLINNPEKRLDKTIKDSLETGLLRLEITYYNKDLPALDNVRKDIDELYNYLRESPEDTYFYASVEEQFKAYCSILKENLIIQCPIYKHLLFVRSINSQTGKINGIYNSNISKDSIIKLMGFLTFGKRPVRVITIDVSDELKEEIIKSRNKEEDSDEEEEEGNNKKVEVKLNPKDPIIIQCKNYIKHIKDGGQDITYITDKTINSRVLLKKYNNPSERGIIDNNDLYFAVPTKKTKFNIKNVFFLENKEIPTELFLESNKKRCLRLETLEEERNEAEALDAIKEEQTNKYKDFLILSKKKELISRKIENIISSFINCSYPHSLTERKIGDVLNIKAVKRIKCKDGKIKYIILDNTTNNLYWANGDIVKHLEDVIINTPKSIGKLTKSYSNIYYYSNIHTLITLLRITILKESDKPYTLELHIGTNQEFVIPTIPKTLNTLIVENSGINGMSVSKLECMDKILKPDTNYIIRTLSKINFRDGFKYGLTITAKDDPNKCIVCKSSHFMEQCLNKIDIYGGTMPYIMLKTGKFKTTPSKNKALFVIMDNMAGKGVEV